MLKKICMFLIILVSFSVRAFAVFDEKNIDQSLHVLRFELKDRYVNIGEQNQLERDRTASRIRMMNKMRQESNIIAMMLYSQKEEYIFSLAYACDRATNLYENFVETMSPLIVQYNVNETELMRYDSIIMVLNRINTRVLTPKAKRDRMECIFWANMIKNITMRKCMESKRSVVEYRKTKRFLYGLNHFAKKHDEDIKEKIYGNGNETFRYIVSHWNERWPYLKMVTKEEYEAEDAVSSYWSISMRKNLINCFAGGFLFAILIGALLVLVARWYVDKFSAGTGKLGAAVRNILGCSKEYPVCSVLTCASILFAATLNVIRPLVTQCFVQMSLDLMGVLSWIFAAILLSSFFMKEGKNVRHAMYLYIPLLFIELFVMFLRINFFPNLVVSFTLPPLIILCTVWELILIFREHKHIGKIDRILAVATEVVFVYLVFCSWNGYTLFTVQILTWWMMQLAFILVFTSIWNYMNLHAKYNSRSGRTEKVSWAYCVVCKLLIPIAAVYSVLLSVYFAGKAFNLGDMMLDIFENNFICNSNVKISILVIAKIISLWFVARFIYFVSKQQLMSEYNQTHITFEQGHSMMYAKSIQILVYGIWLLSSMYMMHISTTWIATAGAGLATGLGFASKTILENVFYGISLLSGRLKIGDLIKVGDVYGNVLNISYSSTVIRNDDGTVVTFTNSQLMEMNYRNLTRIDEFNKQVLNINVGIKSDIDQVRNVIREATSNLPCLHLDEMKNGKPAYEVNVRITGINSFELSSCLIVEVSYWVNPVTEKHDIGVVTECIINALRNKNIEIQ